MIRSPSYLISIVILLTPYLGFADNAKTNVNKVTPFFDDAIKDRAALQTQLDAGNAAAIESIKSNKAAEALPNQNSEAQIDSWSKLDINEAESQGQNVASENNQLLNQVYINKADPLLQAHKRDIDVIINQSIDIMGKMVEKLKDLLEIDCEKQFKNPNSTPEFYITTTQEPRQDEIFDRQLCEALRNNYSCKDVLTLKCRATAMKWEPWQDKTITIEGPELLAYQERQGYLGWTYKWKKRCFSWHINGHGDRHSGPSSDINERMRGIIANKHGVPIDHIGPSIGFPRNGEGEGEKLHPARKLYIWERYTFRYRYRDGQLICTNWDESWRETCTLLEK